MSSNVVGILIIIGMVVLGVVTGGSIFRGGNSNTPNSVNTSEDRYPNDAAYINEPPVTANASEFAGKVFISGVNEPGTFREYINLSAYLDEDERIGITGWKIRSTVTGSEILIGGAANVPTIGVRDQSPIILSGSSEVIISPGVSPIGTSFRVNACVGFLEENRNFIPELRTQCPAADLNAPALSRSIDDECLDYIESLPTCQVPRERDIPEYINLSNACINFLETKVDYLHCVVNHVTDTDFLESEWRVYSEQRGILTREQRENLVLIDNAGKIVDTHSY